LVCVLQELVPWLEDKVYAVEKRLNLVVSDLLAERHKVEDIQKILMSIETITEFGGSNVEQELIAKQNSLKYTIDTLGVQKETASVLKGCYTKIRNTLKRENSNCIVSLKELGKKYEEAKVDLKRILIMRDLGRDVSI
jgi:endonuclease III